MSSRRTITRGRRNRASKLPVVEEPQFDQKRDEPQGSKFRKSKNSPAGPSHVKPETVVVPSLKNCVLPEVSIEVTKTEEQNLSASPPHKVKPETVAVPSLKDCVFQEISIEGIDYSDFFNSLSNGSMEVESLPSDDDPDSYDFLLGVMLDPPGFGSPRRF